MPLPIHHPLSAGLPPRWASAWGEDRHGIFADLTLEGALQRFRWIPPGHFLMGSPQDEEGRWEDEGPQQEVRITRGFWLGDTPVTQALYQAVTGVNPSHFQDPKRPVETVSWIEAREFCQRVNARVPGLDTRLPSEAEWEYACRAGTTGATWLGSLKILGLNKAPGLDSIAWYGGNSGEQYDLENGVDSSGWPEKQYDHRKAGTRKVARKAANPWGLFDMLGNVHEWCEDAAYRPYGADPVEDPLFVEGSRQVIRGGSWLGDARFVRAAYRFGFSTEFRFDSLGFRLARGPALQRGARERATEGAA